MGKVRGRLALDLALGIMLIFEMFYMLTGNTLHEIVGVVFFVTIGIHLLLSRKWMRATRKAFKDHKAFSVANAARVGLAIVLGLIMVLLGVSSLLTSNLLLFATGIDLTGESYTLWANIHTVAAYALCAAVLAHVAVHWVSVVKALRLPYDPGRRQAINAGVSSAAVVGMVALGFAGAKALGDPLAALTGEEVFGDKVPQGAGTSDVSAEKSGPRIGSGEDDAATGRKGSGADRYGGGGDRYARTPDSTDGDGSRNRRGNGAETDGSRGESNGSGNGSRGNGTDRSYGNGPQDGSSRGNGSTPNGGNGNSGGNSGGTAPNSGNGNSGGNSGSGSNGNTSGICTLCRKRCPLSAPQCRKPYDAGLI